MNEEEGKKFDDEIKKMEDFLASDDVNEDPNFLSARLTTINTYMARSGAMLAEARKDQDDRVAELFDEMFFKLSVLPASVAMKYVQAKCSVENGRVNKLDRINRTCVHQADNIRTQISFAKEQMGLERSGY